ncbi:MAG: hypothetical protein K6G15_04290 [Desulfovibrio sp.]|nr:hypothetical protein [Desulfovibrio sp.]
MSELISGTPLGPLLLWPALITACIETVVFWILGFRNLWSCLWFLQVNLISNLLLNEFLLTQAAQSCYDELVIAGEIVVIGLEFALCRSLLRVSSRRLLGTLLLTNAASFGAGLVLAPLLFWLSGIEGPA